MLLKYKVRNFCSFKEEFVFSMKPGKVINRFLDNAVCINRRLKILKAAVIVGENAGGKTCFMKSLHYLQYLFQMDSQIRMLKNLSNNYDTSNIQSFEITVLSNNNDIYTYHLQIDYHSIVSESLSIRTSNQDEVSNKEVFSIKRISSQDATKENILQIGYSIEVNDRYISNELVNIIKARSDYKGLFINYLALIGVDIVIPFVDWIKERLIVEFPTDYSLNIYRKMKKDEEDLAIMRENSFLEIFSLVDSSIVAVEVNDAEPFEKTVVVRKRDDGSEFSIELRNDSSGTKEFFTRSIQLWKVIHKNAVLFADEIDRVLNAVLSEKIIALIQGTEHCGQFVFSTHNVLHLNTNDYMKEQLYFITKQKETLSSELYSLADFKDYRYEKADVYDLYLKGILGGVPND